MAWTLTLDCPACGETFWGDSETKRICPICGAELVVRGQKTHRTAQEQKDGYGGEYRPQDEPHSGFSSRRRILRLSDELRAAILARWRVRVTRLGNCQIRVRTTPKVGVQ